MRKYPPNQETHILILKCRTCILLMSYQSFYVIIFKNHLYRPPYYIHVYSYTCILSISYPCVYSCLYRYRIRVKLILVSAAMSVSILILASSINNNVPYRFWVWPCTQQNKATYINVPRNFLIHILFKSLSLSPSL